jgi:hypothetical protein
MRRGYAGAADPEAALAYEAAITHTENVAERDFLRRKSQALTRA